METTALTSALTSASATAFTTAHMAAEHIRAGELVAFPTETVYGLGADASSDAAVAKIFGYEVAGWLAWYIWAFIHILYLIEFQSRIIVVIRWAFQYLTFSRGARLITGPDHEKSS